MKRKLSIAEFKKIEDWLFANGRELDMARFNVAFGYLDKSYVLHGITLYLNEDGGFAKGIEPDNHNQHSHVLGTCLALNHLYRAGFSGADEDGLFLEIIEGAFDFLYNKVELIDGRWPIIVETNNDFPSAAWWKYESKEKSVRNNNPTAEVIGLTLALLKPSAPYYQRAYAMLDKVIDDYLSAPLRDRHELKCFAFLFEIIKRNNLSHPLFRECLCKFSDDLYESIEKDPGKWRGTYASLPLDVIHDKSLLVDDRFDEIIERHLDFLIDSRNVMGLWEITWTWFNDDNYYEIAFILWASVLAFENLAILERFDRLEEGCLDSE